MGKITSLPSSVYNRVVWTIKDYPRMVTELKLLRSDAQTIGATSYSDMPKSPGHNTTGLDDKVIRIADMERTVKAIDDALEIIPEDMRRGIFDNIAYNVPFPRNEYAQLVPSAETWKRRKRDFIVLTAHKLNIYTKKDRP